MAKGGYLEIILLLVCIWCVNHVNCSVKKGISGWSGSVNCDDYKVLNNMSWYYDWTMDLNMYDTRVAKLHCPSDTKQYLPEHVPMVWSYYPNSTHVHIADNAHYILGFNEPDHTDQANLTPRKAAEYWPDIERHSKGKPLVSPATAGHGFHWLDTFFHLCHNCRVDYIGAHSYKCNADETMHYLKSLHDRYHKKVWLTEFACPYTNNEDDHLHLMQTLLPKLEAADYVFRYSWFMARIERNFAGDFLTPSATLIVGNPPTLTKIGKFYNEYQAPSNPPIVG